MDGLRADFVNGALEKSTCGSGKWCEGGECVKNPNVPEAKCLIEDDYEFCESMKKQYDRATVCRELSTGRCCKYCDSSATLMTRIADQTLERILLQSISKNTFYFPK
jgi:hypothetical protein